MTIRIAAAALQRQPRVRRHRQPLTARAGDWLPLTDFCGVLLAGALSFSLQSIGPTDAALHWQGVQGMFVITAAIAAFMLYDAGFASGVQANDKSTLVRGLTRRALATFGMVITLAYAGRWTAAAPTELFALWLLLSVLSLGGTRLLLMQRLRRQVRRGQLRQSVALIGCGALADASISRLSGDCQLYGLFDERSPRAETVLHRASGGLDDLIDQARRRRPDRILIALPANAHARLLHLVARVQPLGIAIELCQQRFGPLFERPRFGSVGDCLQVTLLADQPLQRWHRVFKTSKDLAIASSLTVLLLPVLAAIALAVKLDSPGPVLFKQLRYGFKGRAFVIYKFRTMVCAAEIADEDLLQTRRGDPRVTRVGRWLRKTSLDELPQIFNVLNGNMSLVGPRPHAVSMRAPLAVGQDFAADYPHRYRVKPGITGWSQVNGERGAIDTPEQLARRIALDLHYVDNWSMALDLKILTRTFREVLRSKHAY